MNIFRTIAVDAFKKELNQIAEWIDSYPQAGFLNSLVIANESVEDSVVIAGALAYLEGLGYLESYYIVHYNDGTIKLFDELKNIPNLKSSNSVKVMYRIKNETV